MVLKASPQHKQQPIGEMFPHLQSQRVNLQLLQESACQELVRLLDKTDGNKISVVLDEGMIGPIGLVALPKFFAERQIKLLKLSEDMKLLPARDYPNVVFIVRPQVKLMNIIAAQLAAADKEKSSADNRMFHLFFVPRRSCVCEKHLENKGVYGSFSLIEELPWHFIALDSDILSMEMPMAFKDIAVDGDPTVLYQAALGLIQIQKLFGCIPKIYGKGQHSQRVWEYAKQLGSEEKLLQGSGEKGAIDQLILLDRSIDIMSALATQLTYQGMIDEFYGIKQNQAKLPAEAFSASSSSSNDPNASSSSHAMQSEDKKVLFLHSGDKLYVQLRDKNFNEVGKILSSNAKNINEQMNPSDKDKIEVMKLLVDKLQSLLAQKQSVALHTTVAEQIRSKLDEYSFTDNLAAEQDYMMCEDIDKPSAYIEDLIAQKDDLRNVLRLMCMQCAAASGFKEKVLNYYKRELAHVYGIEVLLTLSNLEKAGLLYSQSEQRSYAVLRKTLNLTVEDVVEVEPKDISYVHSFYAPLTVRIVEHTLRPLGWQSLKSQINCLPGPTFEDFQAQLIGIAGRQTSTPGEGSLLNIPRIIMVFFVGGCTSAEIAALRFLSQQEDNNVAFVIATTHVINKNAFLDCLMEPHS